MVKVKSSSIAIMQPYLFPYLGYFQLLNAADSFVFYDDVSFIKQGWINRNNILVNNNIKLFTVPLIKASSNSLIKDVNINELLYHKWCIRFLKSIQQSYSKAPYFNDIYPFIEEVFQSNIILVSQLAIASVKMINTYLGLKKSFYVSSYDFPDVKNLGRADRLISIIKELEGKRYINMYGGYELYTKEYFLKNQIELYFLRPELRVYKQFHEPFQSGLSIIDVMMFNNKEEVKESLLNYSLV